MTAINNISCVETFQNLATFSDVQELNVAVNKHIQYNKPLLNKNALRILQHIKGYSRKYKGVSYQTKNNIARELRLSKRTIIRNCNLLEQLGIIKQYKLKRNSDFRQTSNAVVIQQFVNEDSENDTHVSPQKENLSKNTINTYKTTSQMLDHSFVPSFIDSSFVETAKPFFSSAEIYELWLRVLIAYRKSTLENPLVDVIDVVNKAFKDTVFMYKRGKVRTFKGYFYSLVENYLDVEQRRKNQRRLEEWWEE